MKATISFFLAFFIFNLLLSQNPISQDESYLPVVPQAPNVASIQKYQEVPVSKNSGVPQIGIPIFNIQLDNLSVPIMFSYNSSGVRVNEIAPWTGQGWNLIAGGTITRTIRHLSDDDPYGFINNQITTSDIYESCVDETGPYNCIDLIGDKIRNQTLDFEPDIFNYSAPGLSGKFSFNQNRSTEFPRGEIKSSPKSDNIITPNFDSYGAIISWDIRDTSGNEYHFVIGNTINEVESSTIESVGNLPPYAFDPTSTNYTQTWILSKITTYTGKELNFYYFPEDPYTECTFSGQSNSHALTTGEANNLKTTYVETSGKTRQIESIEGDFGEVKFIRSTTSRDDYLQGKSLDQIKIFDASTNLIKKVDLNYSYTISAYPSDNIYGCAGTSNLPGQLYDPNNNPTNYDPYIKRMFLDEVIVFDSSESENFKYTFDYYNDNPMPHRNSYAQDFWGYYNGANGAIGVNNNTLLFNYSKLYTNYPYRHIEQEYAKSGLLKRMYYPEGGFSEFTYENNRAITRSGNAFGFRLVPSDEKIIHFNSLVDKNTDAYEYIDNGAIKIHRFRKPIILNKKTFSLDNELVDGVPKRRAWFKYAIDESVDSSGEYQDICFTDPNSIPQVGDCSFKLTVRKTDLDPELFDDEDEINMSNITYDPDFSFFRVVNDDTEKSKHVLTGVYVLEFDIINWIGNPQGPLFDIDHDYATFDVKCRVAKDDIRFYDDYRQVEIPVGGQRIKTIDDYTDETTLVKSRDYKYVLEDSVKTSGNILRTPYFISYEGAYSSIHESSLSVVPLITTNAGNVNYSRVIEEIVDQNNSNEKLTSINTYTHHELAQINWNPMFPFMEEWRYGAGISTEIPLKSLSTKGYHYNFVGIDPTDLSTFHYGVLPPTTQNPYRFTLEENLEAFDIANGLGGWSGDTFYKLQYGHLSLAGEETKLYIDNDVNQYISKDTHYNYDNPDYLQPSGSETIADNEDKIIQKFYYPHDLVGSNEPYSQNLINENRVKTLIKEETFIQKGTSPPELLNTKKIDYQAFNGNILPEIIKASKGSGSLDTQMVLNSYDDHGNLLDAYKPNGKFTSYIWAYDGQYLVAKIENKAYSAIPPSLITNIHDESVNGTEQDLIDELNALRNNLPDATITTYTYIPLVGVSTITDPKSYQINYVYDDFNRLKYVLDQDDKVLSENEYNYKN